MPDFYLIDEYTDPDYAEDLLNNIWQTAKRYPVIGLDSEWVYRKMRGMKKSVRNPVSLLQLATIDGFAVVIKIQRIWESFELGNSDWNNTLASIHSLFKSNWILKSLFKCNWILKVGVGIHFDVQHLNEDYGYRINKWFDLQHIAAWYNYPKTNLAYLAKVLLGFDVDKSYARIDWDADDLPYDALVYAAEDAKISVEIFNRFFVRRRRETKFEDQPINTIRDMIYEWSDFQCRKYKHIPPN